MNLTFDWYWLSQDVRGSKTISGDISAYSEVVVEWEGVSESAAPLIGC